MAYPTTLDNLNTAASGNEVLNTLGGGVGLAGSVNNANTAINSLETKIGIDGSAVTSTIDYLLKNVASVDPGHHHSNSSIDSVASSKISGQTFPASGFIVGTTDSQALTNKTISGSSNTITNIGTTAITDAAVTSRKMKADQLQYRTTTTDLNEGAGTYTTMAGLSTTFTPNVASNFLVLLNVIPFNDSATGGGSFRVQLDAATQGNDPIISMAPVEAANLTYSLSANLWITGVSQASHTIIVQGKRVAAGNLHTSYASLTIIPFAS